MSFSICFTSQPAEGTAYTLRMTKRTSRARLPHGRRLFGAAGGVTSQGRRSLLASQAFTMLYMQQTYVEIKGQRINLGAFVPDKSSDFVHVRVQGPGSRVCTGTRTWVCSACRKGVWERRCRETEFLGGPCWGAGCWVRQVVQPPTTATTAVL